MDMKYIILSFFKFDEHVFFKITLAKQTFSRVVAVFFLSSIFGLKTALFHKTLHTNSLINMLF